MYRFLFLLLIIASGVLYRMGGAKGYNTKFRDLGVPLIATIYLWIAGVRSWLLLPHFLLLFASLTTYWSFVFAPADHVDWREWAITGFFYGLSAFVLYWAGVPAWTILARIIVLSIATSLWSEWIGWDVLEEGGRGILITATLPILFI